MWLGSKLLHLSAPLFPHLGFSLCWDSVSLRKSTRSFPGSLAGKEYTCNAGGPSSIPGLGRSPGEGHSNPLQYSCLENPHGQRSLVGYSPWGHKELDTTERLSTQHTRKGKVLYSYLHLGDTLPGRSVRWCIFFLSHSLWNALFNARTYIFSKYEIQLFLCSPSSILHLKWAHHLCKLKSHQLWYFAWSLWMQKKRKRFSKQNNWSTSLQ